MTSLLDNKILPAFWAFMIFLGFFAHLPDLGGDTPSRLLFGWAILFAITGWFGFHALRQDAVDVPMSVLFALIISPLYLLLLGLLGHAIDFSFAWTPALVVFALALLFIALTNSGLKQAAFDKILIFAVLTQALMVLGSEDFPLLAAIPGPMAWPSQQVFVFGGYWQVNVMSNILSCLTLWSLWHISRLSAFTPWHGLVALCALILFPLTIGWTNSFSGLVFLLVGLALLSVTGWQQREQLRLWIFMAGVAVTLISLLASSYIGLGVETAPNAVAKAGASSMPDRLGIWLRSYYAFLEAPLFGHGLGHFASIYNDMALLHSDTQGYRWIDNTRNAHNIIVHNLVEIGLIGTIILLGPFVWFGVTLLKRHPQHWATVAILAPVLGHMMTGYPQRQSAVPLLLVVLVVSHMSEFYGAGPMRKISLQALYPRLRLSALAAFVLPAMIGAIWTGIAFSKASARQMMLTHPQYDQRMIPWRFSQPDLQHPFLGHGAQVQAVFGLTSRAVYAQDKANLPRLLGMLSEFERTSIRGRPAWGVLVRGYIVVGDLDKAREVMKIGAALDPNWARATMQGLAEEIKVGRQDILRAIDPNPRPAE